MTEQASSLSFSTFRLSRLPLHWKVLISGYIVLLGSGYLAAALNAYMAVGLSAQAIAEHYGDKTLSEQEQVAIASQGFVEEVFSLDDMGDGVAHEAMDHEAMEHGTMDHGSSGLHGDDTLPAQLLVQLAHIHLLGFAFILISIGGLTCLTQMAPAGKAWLVGLLGVSLFVDIGGLNLTRFVSDGFSWLTLVAGTLIGICLAIMSFRVLWELWGQTRWSR